MEYSSSPESLVLGVLGVLLAGIFVEGAQSRTAGCLPTQAPVLHFLCIPSFEPRARQSRSSINVYYLTGVRSHAARKSSRMWVLWEIKSCSSPVLACGMRFVGGNF